jgi:hypothetical protein
MTTNITSADLNQYKNLRIALKGLYDNISAGRRSESSGNTFKSCHDTIFPTESDASYGDSQKLTTTGNFGETDINGNAISLQKLLINTLYPTFHQTIIENSYSAYTNSDLVATAGSKKDHLCFIKYASSKANIEPDKYPITNILYSKYAIEIFIKINEALMDCYYSHTNDFDTTFTSSTKIYIVDKYLKGDHEIGVPRGIFINNTTSSSDNDEPPNAIYLYIGDLKNMFKDDDIKMWDSTTQSASAGLSEDYKRSPKSIFTSSNKLNIKNGIVYNFGYLDYGKNSDTESKYPEQSGRSQTPPVEARGTMTGVSLASGTIFSSATINAGSSITGLKILNGSTIVLTRTDPAVTRASPDVSTPDTYNYIIKSGSKIGGTISTGAFIKAGSDINRSAVNISKITLGGADSFTNAVASLPDAKVQQSTLIKSTESLQNNVDIGIGEYILPDTGATFTTDIGFTTTTQINMGGFTTYSVTSDITPINPSTITYPALNIGEYTLASTISNTRITGTFQNLAGVANTPQSFYEQNIYYIFNFIKMIKHIDKASFSTTSKYLHIYILCYKSLLLASIRAANIFYNNRHRLNAVAISYENDFLNNALQESGGSGCAKKSLNDFVKNDHKANFSSTSTCTSPQALPVDTYMGGNGFKYILYKQNAGSADNNEMFKAYDKRILEELDNLSNTKVKESTGNLGITNFQIFSSFVLKGKFTITSYDSNVHDKIDGSFRNSAPDNDYKILKDIFYNNKTYDFNKNYRIKIVDDVFKVIKFNTRKDYAGGDRIDIELEQDKTIQTELYNKLNNYSPSVITQQDHPVYIVKITSKDIDKDYNAIVKNTNTIEENINMYKTKIKNNTTLYELHKSRNNLLYNQVLSYLIIVAVIISILVIINVANVEKPLIKSITLACLAVIIILFMSYYIMNTLYIEEGFAEGSGSTHEGYDLCPKDTCKISNDAQASGIIVEEKEQAMLKRKKDFVKNFLEDKAEKLMLMIILETPSIVNDSLKGNNEKLVAISKNIYNDKLYLKDVLYSKKSDSEMNVDVLKYENKNYDTYIICVLFLALIMVGSYTINIYTDNKYLDLLILIMVILFVCLFTYFVLYTNRVVRTVSTNYYWGNEYENQYI